MKWINQFTRLRRWEGGCCLVVLCFLFSFWSWRFEMRFATENDMIPLIPGLGCIIPYNPMKWVLQPECQTICTRASRPQFTGATSIFNFFLLFLSFFSFFPCVFLCFLERKFLLPFYLLNPLFILVVNQRKTEMQQRVRKTDIPNDIAAIPDICPFWYNATLFRPVH